MLAFFAFIGILAIAGGSILGGVLLLRSCCYRTLRLDIVAAEKEMIILRESSKDRAILVLCDRVRNEIAAAKYYLSVRKLAPGLSHMDKARNAIEEIHKENFVSCEIERMENNGSAPESP